MAMFRELIARGSPNSIAAYAPMAYGFADVT
jgi:hypothetical protein